MASWNQQLEVGQKLWKEGVGSGKITHILWPFKLIYVDFYEKGTKTLEFDEVLGNWTEDYGGSWMLYDI